MNKYRHFYFYANGCYKVTDEVSDLKQVMKAYNGCTDNVSTWEIISVLSEACAEYANRKGVSNFVNHLADVSRKDIFASERHPVDISLIKVYLRYLRIMNKDDIGEVGEPDYTILEKGNW